MISIYYVNIYEKLILSTGFSLFICFLISFAETDQDKEFSQFPSADMFEATEYYWDADQDPHNDRNTNHDNNHAKYHGGVSKLWLERLWVYIYAMLSSRGNKDYFFDELSQVKTTADIPFGALAGLELQRHGGCHPIHTS